jgi:hypothetical protein
MEIVERETTFYIGRQNGRHLFGSRLASAGIKATLGQIERRIKSSRESMDRGECR